MRKQFVIVAVSAVCLLAAVSMRPGVVAQASATPAASRVATAAPAGRTLQVAITGLAKGVPAHVRVTGPSRYSKQLAKSGTLRGLRPGTYRVATAPAAAPHASRIYPATRVLSVKVTSTRGALARVRYVTVVPRTTKAVSARQISSVQKVGSRQVIHFAGRPALQVGNVVASGVGPSTPNGLLAKVTAVARNGAVTVAPTTLLQAIPQGALNADAVLTSANLSPAARRSGMRVAADGSVTKPVDGSFGKCTGDAKATIEGSISILPAFHLAAAWNLLHGVTSAQLTADVTESSELKASIDAAGSCDGKRTLFPKPKTFATFVVEVGGIPIVLQPQLQLTFTGHAGVEAAITTSSSQNLSIGAGLQYTRAGGVRPIQTVSHSADYEPPKLTASGSVTASVNPEIDLLIDGFGGPEVGLTGGLELSADVDANPWWTLEGYLSGNAGITIPLLKVDKRVTLARKKWVIAHAPRTATPEISVSPEEAEPWNDSVCGFHSDNSDLEITGSGFRPGERVDLSSDWTDFDTVTADDDGTFDVSQFVGEVPGTDHDDYGVYASGDAGSNASSSVELNADSCSYIVSESDGEVTFQWGVNGHDPDSDVTLLIDDEDTDYATTDDGGSGGSTVTFDCPDSGSFTWDTEGTDDGHGESLDGGPLTAECDPSGSDALRSHVASSPPASSQNATSRDASVAPGSGGGARAGRSTS